MSYCGVIEVRGPSGAKGGWCSARGGLSPAVRRSPPSEIALFRQLYSRTPASLPQRATDSDVQPKNQSLEGPLRRELTFIPMPKENVLRTLYTLRLYPALKSSERVTL